MNGRLNLKEDFRRYNCNEFGKHWQSFAVAFAEYLHEQIRKNI
jgi:cobalamin-dependent methionine synthase I